MSKHGEGELVSFGDSTSKTNPKGSKVGGPSDDSRLYVAVAFYDQIVQTFCLSNGQSVSVGNDPGADVVVPNLVSSMNLVTFDASREPAFYRVRVPEGANLVMSDGSVRDGLEPVESQQIAQLTWGSISFHFRIEEKEETKSPFAFQTKSWGFFGASFAVHGILLSTLLFLPPSAGALSRDLTNSESRYIRAELLALEQQREEVVPEAATGDVGEGGPPASAPGEQGSAGNENDRRDRGGRPRNQGQSANDRVAMTAGAAANTAVIRNMASAIAFDPAFASAFGAETPEGSAEQAIAGLLANESGLGAGTGGLTMSGVGRGGGCRGSDCAAGALTVGAFSTRGGGGTCGLDRFNQLVAEHGRAYAVSACDGGLSRGGNGIRDGIAMNDRRERTPVLRMERPELVGGLSAEQIRLVITRNRNQISHCYEQELQRRPDIAGRVTMSFMINQAGSLQNPRVSSSSLNSSPVEQCIAEKMQTWHFPSSPSPTAVTYPFMFQSQS